MGTIRASLVAEAEAILEADIAANRRLGAHGAALVPHGARILTHCNAGGLATAGYGTALGVVRAAVDNVAAVRDVVGPDVDICIEVHGRLSPAWAIEMARRLRRFAPLFYEEPVPVENARALARVARAIKIPVATGERLCTKFAFQELFALDAVDIVQPDLCHAGGLTEVKKIAAMAEASYVQVAPHNASGPIGTAAAIQLDASIPNFLIQEYFVTQAQWIDEVVPGAPRAVKGEIAVPDRPGLGVELNEQAALAHPFQESWGGKTLFSPDWHASLPDRERMAGS